MSTNDDPLLTTPEAAAFLTVSTSTLERWRLEELGPSYVSLGTRVRYRTSALNQYIEENTTI